MRVTESTSKGTSDLIGTPRDNGSGASSSAVQDVEKSRRQGTPQADQIVNEVLGVSRSGPRGRSTMKTALNRKVSPSGRRALTVRAPASARQRLFDTKRFLAEPEAWQGAVLAALARTLISKYDVIRFACCTNNVADDGLGGSLHGCDADRELYGGSDDSGCADVLDKREQLAEWRLAALFDALLRIVDDSAENSTAVDPALDLLSCVVSAGVPTAKLDTLVELAREALHSGDARMQLRLLHVLDRSIRRSDPMSEDLVWCCEELDKVVALALRGDSARTNDARPAAGTAQSLAFVKEQSLSNPDTNWNLQREPGAFFNCSGPKSGVRISGLGQWPLGKEYSLWFWVRLEQGCGRCTVLRLQTADKKGIHYSIVGDDVIGYSLNVESKDDRGQTSVRIPIPPAQLRSRRWHQMTVHHYTRMIGAPVIKFYVDGSEIKQSNGYNFSLPLPQASKLGGQMITAACALEGLDGQAGPFYLFQKSISLAAGSTLAALHQHHSTYGASDRFPACAGSGLLACLADNGLEEHVLFCYDPRAVVGTLALDVYGGHHGLLLHDTFPVGWLQVRNSLLGIGGVPMLLPFVLGTVQSTSGVLQSVSGDSPSTDFDTQVGADRSLGDASINRPEPLCSGACLIQSIHLLARVIRNHPVHLRRFRELGGPSLVASALEHIPKAVLVGACSDQLVPGPLKETSRERGQDEEHDDQDHKMEPESPSPLPPLLSALCNLWYAVGMPDEKRDPFVFGDLSSDEPATRVSSSVAFTHGLGLPFDGANESKTSSDIEEHDSCNSMQLAVYSELLFSVRILARCTKREEIPVGDALEDGESPYNLSRTQIKWLEFLAQKVLVAPGFFRRVIGLQIWLDGVREFYKDAALKRKSTVGSIDHFKTFVEEFGRHATIVSAAFVSDAVSDDDLRALVGAAIGAGFASDDDAIAKSDVSVATHLAGMIKAPVLSPQTTPTKASSRANLTPRVGSGSKSVATFCCPAFSACGGGIVDLLLARDALRVLTLAMRIDPAPKQLFDRCASIDSGNGLAWILSTNVIASQHVGDEIRSLGLRCMSEYLLRLESGISQSVQLEKLASQLGTEPDALKADLGVGSAGIRLFASSGGYASLRLVLAGIASKWEREKILMNSGLNYVESTIGEGSSASASNIFRGFDSNASYSVLLEMMISEPVASLSVQNGNDKAAKAAQRDLVLRQRRRSSLGITTNPFMSSYDLLDLNEASDIFVDQSRLGPMLDDSHLIANPHVLALVVELLPRMGLYLKQRVCQDLLLLLKFQPANRHALTSIHGWEACFLGLLGSLDQRGNDGARVCFDLSVKLLLLVLQDALLEQPFGWKGIETLIGLHSLIPENGKALVHRVVVDLLASVYQHLQSEDVSDFFSAFWPNLQQLVVFVDLLCTLPANKDDNDILRAAQLLLDIVDLVTTFPAHLLDASDLDSPGAVSPFASKLNLTRATSSSSSTASASDSKRNPKDVLERFAWPLSPTAQTELTKIRGPPCFALLTLSLAAAERASLSSPALPKSIVRISRLIAMLRFIPKITTLVRWAPGPKADRIKGEKSALVARALCLVLSIAVKAREGERYKDPATSLALSATLGLLEEMCHRHAELLSLIVQDDLVVQRFEAIAAAGKIGGVGSKDATEWVLRPCLAKPAVAGTGPHPFAGLPGALRALKEGSLGCRSFLELRLKTLWENHCALEISSNNTKVRIKREISASTFQQQLGRAEQIRLAMYRSHRGSKEVLAQAQWRNLTVESDLDCLHPEILAGKVQSHWMISDKEDHMRCRRLMARSFHSDNYQDAVYRKQAGQQGSKDMISSQIASVLPPTFARPAVNNARSKAVAATREVDLTWFKWLGGIIIGDLPKTEDADKAILVQYNFSDQLAAFKWLGGKMAQARQNIYVDSQTKTAATSGPGDIPRIPSSNEASPNSRSTLSKGSPRDPSKFVPWVTEAAEQKREQFVLEKSENLLHVCSNAQWITPLQVTRGRLEISTRHIFFYASHPLRATAQSYAASTTAYNAKNEMEAPNGEQSSGHRFSSRARAERSKEMMRWRLCDLTEIFGRRYLLRSTALELFFKDMTNSFFCFPSPQARVECLNAIVKQPTPLLRNAFKNGLDPKKVFEKSGILERWRKREISNFEYIMRLNTMAGRSYNDITQYPVFPWIIKDYTSETIDLNDPQVFRDLSKPIGALNEKRLEEFVERFENFADACMEIPPFHYGSHYSNAGIVLHFLLRVEPFTSMAVELQGGKFDCPDRLFFSLADSWRGSMESMSDVKELVPEFFYCPEMFANSNRLPLGFRDPKQDDLAEVPAQPLPQAQDSIPVDHVELPPWAKGSPHEFVRINREALESEYVSANLHKWVDLVFGCKQLGEAAEEAHNVFYYLTYEGAVDLDAIADPVQRQSIESQIAHFGQTPSQLLKKPHPARMPMSPRHRLLERLVPRVQGNSAVDASVLSVAAHQVWSTPTNRSSPTDASGGPGAGKLFPFSSYFRSGPAATKSSPGGNMSASSLSSLGSSSSNRGSPSSKHTPSEPALVYVKCLTDRIVTVHEDYSVSTHRIAQDSAALKSTGATRLLSAAALSKSGRAQRLRDGSVPLFLQQSDRMRVDGNCFACAKQGKLLLSVNYLDGSFRAQNLDNHRVEDAAVAHRGRALCVALCEEEEFVITGGIDCTLAVWVLGGPSDIRDEVMSLFGAGPDVSSSSSGGVLRSKPGAGTPLRDGHDFGSEVGDNLDEFYSFPGLNSTSGASGIAADIGLGAHSINSILNLRNKLFGHVSPVTSVAVSNGFSIIVSGSSSGQVLVHSLQEGTLIRALNCASQLRCPITSLEIAAVTGNIVSVSDRKSIKVFTINGVLISDAESEHSINALTLGNASAAGRELVLTAESDGAVHVRNAHNLQPESTEGGDSIVSLNADASLCALTMAPGGHALVTGNQKGQLSIVQLSAFSATMDL